MEKNHHMTMLDTARKEKQAAKSSLERIQRSIEGALEKEKMTAEKAAVNRYIRDASLRMGMHLPIKPAKKELPQENIQKMPEYKLPSLHHVERMIKADLEPKAENTAGRFTSMSHETHSGSTDSTPRLPPIIIDTGQRERVRGAKRKRKATNNDHKDANDNNKDANNNNKGGPSDNKKDITKRVPVKTARSRSGGSGSDDESLNVVLCGRSTLTTDDIGERRELFVSRHGRFKSK